MTSRPGGDNPFYVNKREYEERPLFWLPRDFAKIEQNKPVYVIGSRGTGKTTLLRALSWQERATNPSLQDALNGRPFSGKYVGLYFRLPEYIAKGLFDAESPNDQRTHTTGHRFSLYMELVALQLLVHALGELRKMGHLSFTAVAEVHAVEEILESFPGIAAFMGWDREELVTLRRLRSAFLRMHSALREYALSGGDYPLPWAQGAQNTTWLREIAASLLELAGNSWRVKICLDEAECLSPYQQRVVNTWARLLAHPLSLVVAFADRPWDTASTLIPDVMNSDDDVWKWNLDEEYAQPGKFKSFASGVAAVRLGGICDGDPPSFSLDEMFSDYGVNDLLAHLLRSSDRADLRDTYLVPSRRSRTNNDSTDEGGSRTEEFRIYQHYLRDLLHVKAVSTRDARAQDSGLYRKCQVAALISFCYRYGFSVPYAGARVVLDLSDSCIRDFLRQMSSVFDLVGQGLKSFSSVRLSIVQQGQAIRDASRNKFGDIKKVVSSVTEVESMIRGLGRVLHSIQTNPELGVKVPERGIIVASLDSSSISDQLIRILGAAEQGGLIRILSRGDTAVHFVLHRLLSPLFEISHRRPYYVVPVQGADILSLCFSKTEAELQRLVEGMVFSTTANLLGADQPNSQQTLFPQ